MSTDREPFIPPVAIVQVVTGSLAAYWSFVYLVQPWLRDEFLPYTMLIGVAIGGVLSVGVVLLSMYLPIAPVILLLSCVSPSAAVFETRRQKRIERRVAGKLARAGLNAGRRILRRMLAVSRGT